MVCLLVGCLAGATAGPAVASAAGVTVAGADAPEPDSVLLHITVDRDGDARWLVEYRVRLDDENETAAFEAYAEDIETNTGRYRERFASRMRATAADAENATGRPMAVGNVTVATRTEELPVAYGVVAYRFRWTGFAVPTDDGIRAGDAIGGLFLDSRSTLVLRGPPDHRAVAATPEPDRLDRAATWAGPASFEASEPRVTFEPAPAGSQTPTAAAAGDDAGGERNALVGDDRTGGLWLLAFGLLVVGGAVVAVVYVGRGDGVDAPGTGDADGSAAADGTGAGTVGPGTRADATGQVAGPGAPADPELLSNEEQVLRLLEERGRVKQPMLAEELGWTASKTSKVITSLREEGRVETFRVGHENVVEPVDGDT